MDRDAAPEAAQGGPLRIVLVSTQRQWGGGEEQARLLVRGLCRQGHECLVLARRHGALAARLAADCLPVAVFSGGGRGPLAIWQMRRQLRRVRPDVLHYNDPHAVSSAGLASWALGIRARVAARRAAFPVRAAARYRWFCDRVVCVSRAVSEVCLRSGIAAKSIRVVYDGVDPERALSGDRERGRRALGIADDRPLLLTVAKLTECKGHAFLLEALRTVVRECPQACLGLVGEGELSADLKRLARQLGVEAHVRFVGYREDVPDLIRAADLFVLPSQSEGLGSTLIDVMLAGPAIVTTTAGGIPELTGSDDPGAQPAAWSVAPGDGPSLAAALLEALRSPEERSARQQRARRRAQERFTADRMVEATLEVYREALGARPGHPNPTARA